jgi:ribokinase
LVASEIAEAISTIVVVGSINADLLTYVDDSKRIGNYVFGDDFRFNLGGKGLNQALNVSASGQPVLLLGRVGNDFFGREILLQLGNRGIKTDLIVKDRIAHTGIGHIRVSNEGEYDTVVINGANSFLDKSQIDEAFKFKSQPSFILMNYEILSEVVAHAATIARAQGIKTIINLSPIADGLVYSIDNADFLILNDDEARAVLKSEEKDPSRLALALREKGAKNVVITLGVDGVFAIDDSGEIFSCGHNKVTVENTIGAGDTFLSIFAVALNAGKSFGEAILIANYAASVVCTKKESFLAPSDLLAFAGKFGLPPPPPQKTLGAEYFHD